MIHSYYVYTGVYILYTLFILIMYIQGGASDQEPACQFRRRKRRGFDPWVGKIP